MDSIFGFIIHPMELGVIWLAVHFNSAGIGIIVFTLLVRLVLAPLLIVQLRNAKKMQRLQPMIGELRQKHGKDKQALSQATMALYKEHNTNPAMGCLPTLLQFPILIGLFYGLRHLGQSPSGFPHKLNFANTTCSGFTIHTMPQWLSHCYAVTTAAGSPHVVFDLFHANFLWLSNGLGGHDPLFLLPILAGVTQWIQSRMMLTKSTDAQQQMMNTMMNFMPLMIIFFALNYASGLSLYWVTSTLIGIAIQYRITGLGLLPDTLRGLASRFSGAAGSSSAGRSSGVRTQSSGTRVPKKKMNNRARPLAVTDGSTAVNGLNGSSGDGTNTENGGGGETTVVARPRKKANRAKGGRGGGRRG